MAKGTRPVSNELEGRQWFVEQARRVFIATAIVTALSLAIPTANCLIEVYL